MYMFEMLLINAANEENARDNKNLKIWVQVRKRFVLLLFDFIPIRALSRQKVVTKVLDKSSYPDRVKLRT